MKHLDDQMKEFLEDVVGVVEATSYEKMCIWAEYHKLPGYTWDQKCSGYLETVGFLKKRPICISLHINVVNGHKILFWDATSQVVDHKKIDKWFKKNLPGVKRTDAMNFHNIIPRENLK